MTSLFSFSTSSSSVTGFNDFFVFVNEFRNVEFCYIKIGFFDRFNEILVEVVFIQFFLKVVIEIIVEVFFIEVFKFFRIDATRIEVGVVTKFVVVLGGFFFPVVILIVNIGNHDGRGPVSGNRARQSGASRK